MAASNITAGAEGVASKPFGYPDTVESQGVYLASKTRKLPSGKFEAVAALFSWGKRGLTVYAVADSRPKAKARAEQATQSQPKLRRSLTRGWVSYSPAIGGGA